MQRQRPSGAKAPIKVASKQHPYEVFRYRPGPEVTLDDARDAYEMCRYLHDPKQKEACYAVFGVNGEAVERYLPLVLLMEKAWEHPDEWTTEDLAELRIGSVIIKVQRRL